MRTFWQWIIRLRPTSVPEPALVRSTLVAASGVVAYVLGRQIGVDWIGNVMTVYGLASPLLAGILIRPAVSPVPKPASDSES